MNEERFDLLFYKYIRKEISEEERKEFFYLVNEPGSETLLRKFSRKYDIPDHLITSFPEHSAQALLQAILNRNPEITTGVPEILRKRFLPDSKWVRAAAAIFILAFTTVYYFISTQNNKEKAAIARENRVIKDAMPGRQGAVLTLSSGDAFLLDTVQNTLLKPGIVKSEDILQVNGAEELYATLQTPPGRQQTLQLSDGSKVWLNAGSILKFPLVFKRGKREVELTGEAYFDVYHKKNQPFIVRAGNKEIIDLGTRFNVNAYPDEGSMATTLVEGSVQIDEYVMKPGEQYMNDTIRKVDADASIAWVSGYFHFQHTDLMAVMRQIARWYDVEIEYQGDIPAQFFDGEIQRSLRLSQVMELLNATGIHYTLDDKRLIIRP